MEDTESRAGPRQASVSRGTTAVAHTQLRAIAAIARYTGYCAIPRVIRDIALYHGLCGIYRDTTGYTGYCAIPQVIWDAHTIVNIRNKLNYQNPNIEPCNYMLTLCIYNGTGKSCSRVHDASVCVSNAILDQQFKLHICIAAMKLHPEQAENTSLNDSKILRCE